MKKLIAPPRISRRDSVLSAYPNRVLAFDEAQGKVVDPIPTATGLPTGMRLSYDHKKIYVITNDHCGVEVLDIATRKIVSNFVLERATSGIASMAARPILKAKCCTR